MGDTPFLTPKQKRMLDFITEFRVKNGYAPSQQEIAQHFGFKSLGTVQNYLVRLERQGALKKAWNARRGTEVIAPQPHLSASMESKGKMPMTMLTQGRAVEAVPAPSVLHIPLVGRVAAGFPLEAILHNETIEVPVSLFKAGASTFALKVTGDSMIEDGILDGDYVIIRKQDTAENGQTVVALINNEATIKRFYKKRGAIELHAANPKYKPIIVESGEFKIEGILSGVIRLCR